MLLATCADRNFKYGPSLLPEPNERFLVIAVARSTLCGLICIVSTSVLAQPRDVLPPPCGVEQHPANGTPRHSPKAPPVDIELCTGAGALCSQKPLELVEAYSMSWLCTPTPDCRLPHLFRWGVCALAPFLQLQRNANGRFATQNGGGRRSATSTEASVAKAMLLHIVGGLHGLLVEGAEGAVLLHQRPEDVPHQAVVVANPQRLALRKLYTR